MPIPTPAQVKRYFDYGRMVEREDGQYVLWSEVEVLLLQRAQESQELLQAVLDAIKGTLDTSTQIADHPNVKFAQFQRLTLEAHLAARAQEIEQVKAALIEADRWFDGWCPTATCCAASGEGVHEQIRAALKADAALVSRAPQQEQEP